MKGNELSFHHPVAFWLGCLAVVAGVLMHMPMFAMGEPMHWQLVGMPMDNLMLGGMGLIATGVLLATYGLMPRL
ncbi:MAG: sugar phosphate permease, partial [Xanthomonadaceae bacterium]|nr:sugar phosphate permease [Xanthomonadaceae bacterium]